MATVKYQGHYYIPILLNSQNSSVPAKIFAAVSAGIYTCKTGSNTAVFTTTAMVPSVATGGVEPLKALHPLMQCLNFLKMGV